MTNTLCGICTHCKTVISGIGSQFFLCRLSQTDRRFAKYPPQPVVRCAGFAAVQNPASTGPDSLGD